MLTELLRLPIPPTKWRQGFWGRYRQATRAATRFPFGCCLASPLDADKHANPLRPLQT